MSTTKNHSPLVPRKLARHIYAATTADGANIGCAVSNDGAVSIDLPLTAGEALAWRAEIARLTAKPLKAVLFTSPNRFTSEALGALATGRLRLPALLHDAGHHTLFAALESASPHAPELGLPFHVREQAGLPEVTFSERATVALGGSVDPLFIDVMHVGGCAPGASYVTVRDSGIVFVGDHVAVGEPPAFGAGELDKWIKALTALPRSKNIKMVVPGRGAIGTVNSGASTLEFVRALKTALAKFNRREHAREEIAALAPSLVALFDHKRRGRGDAPASEDLYAARIRAGLEEIFDAQRRETQAIIV